MQKIKLNDGNEMPILGFGTYLIDNADECVSSVLTALETGYRLIDTAQFYKNEAAIGQALQRSNVPRSELFLTTKLWFHSYETDAARKAVESSLQALGTDYLDLVLLHWPFGNTYAAWRVLEEYQQQGVIRSIGISNYGPDRALDLMHFNQVRPAVNQVELNLWCQRQSEQQWFNEQNIALQAYTPMGRNRSPELFEAPELVAIATHHGKTVRQVMLRFLIQLGIAVIPKSTHPERIRENFQLFDFELSADEMAQLVTMDRAEALIGITTQPPRMEHLFSRR